MASIGMVESDEGKNITHISAFGKKLCVSQHVMAVPGLDLGIDPTIHATSPDRFGLRRRSGESI
jgi:hypothetical protein